MTTQLYCTPEHSRQDHYRRHPGSALAARERAKSKPGYVADRAERVAGWVKDNPERATLHFRRAQLAKYGLSLEGYDRLFAEKGGACWICARQMAEVNRSSGRVRHLHVDHDHTHADADPAGVRGLLDTWCNTRLALVEDAERVAELRAFIASRASWPQPPVLMSGARVGSRWTKFRLTTEQYEAMVLACGELCEVCGHPEQPYASGQPRSLSVEHNHAKKVGEPGFIRGLVCNRCNSALGVVENTDWWSGATAYLQWGPPLVRQFTAGCPPEPRRRRARS